MQSSLQGAGSPSPLLFSLFKNTVFGTLRNDTTTDNDVNIRIITFKHNFRLTFQILGEIAGNQLVYINVAK